MLSSCADDASVVSCASSAQPCLKLLLHVTSAACSILDDGEVDARVVQFLQMMLEKHEVLLRVARYWVACGKAARAARAHDATAGSDADATTADGGVVEDDARVCARLIRTLHRCCNALHGCEGDRSKVLTAHAAAVTWLRRASVKPRRTAAAAPVTAAAAESGTATMAPVLASSRVTTPAVVDAVPAASTAPASAPASVPVPVAGTAAAPPATVGGGVGVDPALASAVAAAAAIAAAAASAAASSEGPPAKKRRSRWDTA